MSTISVTLPTDGTTADTSDYNTPITTITNAINGNLDSTNISSLSGTKITAGTIPGSALDSTAIGGYITGLNAPTTVTALGNRSYSMVFNSVNYSTSLSAGMRLRTTRTVAAPTQCTSLNGTTQYYSKTSPAGLSFTTTFTCSAWVKLNAYGVGGIINRRNADTEGWSFFVDANGAVNMNGLRIAANSKSVVSYQSVPLNKWIHVAATMDMTAGASTGGLVYIDGVLVPSVTASTGTASALVQGTSALVVGALKSDGTSPFNGKIAQAAVYSSVLSAATILAQQSYPLAGTETGEVSAYSFNNSINDLNANANNLTANGSAVATSADSPFGGQADGTISSTLDYAIIQKVAFSTNTTVTVQVPEGCTIPTSGGVSSVVYSSNKAPYGMPVQQGKWEVTTIQLTDETISISATSQWFPSLGAKLTVPLGEWLVGYQFSLQAAYTSSGAADINTLMSATVPTNGVTNQELTSYISLSGTASGFNHHVKKDVHASVAAATTYTQYGQSSIIGATASWRIRGSQDMALFYARNAYL